MITDGVNPRAGLLPISMIVIPEADRVVLANIRPAIPATTASGIGRDRDVRHDPDFDTSCE